MLVTLTYITLVITVLITGYIAWLFVRDPQGAMETATHRLDLLPQVMTGRYIVVFLLALGALIYADVAVAAYFFAVCTFLGLYDGWLYWSRGLPHIKHTATGLLALGAFVIAILALALPGGAA